MIVKSKISELNLNKVIMDSMPGLVFFFAKDGQLVAWNKKCEEILGYSREEFENSYAGKLSVKNDQMKNPKQPALPLCRLLSFGTE